MVPSLVFTGLAAPITLANQIGERPDFSNGTSHAGMASSGRLARLRAAICTGVFLLACCAPHLLLSQIGTGRVTGTVTDSTGAVIPNAVVTLRNVDTGIASTVPSTSTGAYVFDAVDPGRYLIRVQHEGFDAEESRSIEVHIQQTVTQDFQLEVGRVTNTITVTNTAPLLQLADASIGLTVDQKTIDDMPLNGRNWVSLGQLAAGVTIVGTPSSPGGVGQPFFTADGVNWQQNDYRLNGIDDNLEVFGTGGSIGIQSDASIVPPPDAIQEFTMQNGDYNAEIGHSTGAVVNAMVKSGTNKFRGVLWEYLRNQAFDANDYFSNQRGVPKASYHQNEYGGTNGGPVIIPGIYNGRDKTFYFFDYQVNSIIQPFPSTQTIPTLAMRNSGFTDLQDLITYNSGSNTDALGRVISFGTILDPATTRMVAAGATDPISGLANTTGSAIYVRDPFYTGSLLGVTNFTGLNGLNQIPQSRIDPNAVKIFDLLPQPTSFGYVNNFYDNPKQNVTVHQYDIRVDHNLSSSDLLWGAFSWFHTLQFQPSPFPGLADGQVFSSGNSDSPHYALALSYTHVFTPRLTNELHFGFDKDTDNIEPQFGNQLGIPAQYGIQGVPQFPGNGGLPPITIGGLYMGVSGYIPTLRSIHSIETMDNVTKVHGNHTFKTGFQIVSLRANIKQPPNGRGSFNYSGQFTDIPNQTSGFTALGDFLLTPTTSTVPGGIDNLGGLSSFSGSNADYTDDHRWYEGIYFQDNWKITPALTLNAGIRWDHYTPPEDVHGREANFRANNGNGPGGIYYLPQKTCNTPVNSNFAPILAADNITLKCISGSLASVPYYNFAPRMGIAWRVRQNTALRAGYGIAYGALDSQGFSQNLGLAYPFAYSLGFTAPGSQQPLLLPNGSGETATIENALTSINLTNAVESNPLGATLFSRQWDSQVPYAETYNLTIQQELTAHDAFQIAYVGVQGHHLDSVGTTNTPSQILPPGTNVYDYIPFPHFGWGSNYTSTNSKSHYNSMQLTYARRLSAGLSMNANYTWSQCMTNQLSYLDGIGAPNPSLRAEWLPGFGFNKDLQLCPNDASSVVHISGIYDLPFGAQRHWLAGSRGIVQGLLGGWSVNFIFTKQTGQPFTIGCPVATTADYGCNANRVPNVDLYAGPHNQQQWLNPAAFSQPPIATAIGQLDYSPLGSNGGQARAPGFYNLDSSIFKEFPIKEELHLQFRAEAFNTLNTPQFGIPGQLNFNNLTDFSQITSLINQPRLMQFALKLYY